MIKKVFSIVRGGVRAVKTRMDERKRLPDECKLTWLDKVLVLLAVASGYYIGGKGVLFIERRFLYNEDDYN